MPVCPWCQRKHGENHLCEPARRILDSYIQQAREKTMPGIELPEGVSGPGERILGEDSELARQITVSAAVIEVAGDHKAALIFSGLDADNKPLPRWLYIGNDTDLTALVQLVTDMAGIATRRAQEART